MVRSLLWDAITDRTGAAMLITFLHDHFDFKAEDVADLSSPEAVSRTVQDAAAEVLK